MFYNMASIKLILRNKQNNDGTFSIAIQILKNRKASLIHVGHSVKFDDWDAKNQRVKKSHPNSVRLNNLLLKKVAEANDKLIETETKEEDYSSNVIKKRIRPNEGISFFDQAKIFTDNLQKNGKFNRYTTDIGRIKIFREFLKGHDITFPEITVNLLNQFRAWLKSTRKVSKKLKKPISERTIVNYLLLIRTIYNQAAKNHIIDKKNYPFGKEKIALKFPDSLKVGLSREEVKTLEEIELSGYQNHARNVWLVSFYFAGMRLSDVMRLKWSDFQDERIHYTMTKNLKAGSLKIPEKALAIIEKYSDDEPKHGFIFPELKVLDELDPYEVQRKISYAGKRLDKALKEILKKADIKRIFQCIFQDTHLLNLRGTRYQRHYYKSFTAMPRLKRLWAINPILPTNTRMMH